VQQTISLIDDLVGASEQRRRLAGPETDDRLILGRRLHWQVRRASRLYDAVNVTGRTTEPLDLMRAKRSTGSWLACDSTTISLKDDRYETACGVFNGTAI
jgi:hypothetical protein